MVLTVENAFKLFVMFLKANGISGIYSYDAYKDGVYSAHLIKRAGVVNYWGDPQKYIDYEITKYGEFNLAGMVFDRTIRNCHNKNEMWSIAFKRCFCSVFETDLYNTWDEVANMLNETYKIFKK